ncbi:MAG TPA: hypothetical protein PLP62_06900 [Flavobacteriaceae bacterium]|nr:hypothetical protein [Flavobacteriaceae bacterium]
MSLINILILSNSDFIKTKLSSNSTFLKLSGDWATLFDSVSFNCSFTRCIAFINLGYQLKCVYYLFFPGGLDFSDDKKDTDKTLSKK